MVVSISNVSNSVEAKYRSRGVRVRVGVGIVLGLVFLLYFSDRKTYDFSQRMFAESNIICIFVIRKPNKSNL